MRSDVRVPASTPMTALPYTSLCNASWPVAYDEVDFLARRRSGVSPAAVSYISLSDWWPQMLPVGSCPFPSPGQGNGLPPLLIRGRSLLSAGQLGHRKVWWGLGDSQEGQKGNSPDPKGAYNDSRTEATTHYSLSPGTAGVLLFLSNPRDNGDFPD